MMSVWNLVWIVPLTAVITAIMLAVLSANKIEEE